MKIPLSQYRRTALISFGLATLWVVLAFLRSGTTFHLAPILVTAAFPVVFAYDIHEQISPRDLVLPTAAGLAVALFATLLLTVAGKMTGPSLLPFGGAVTETVIFSIAGAVAGFVIATLRRKR